MLFYFYSCNNLCFFSFQENAIFDIDLIDAKPMRLILTSAEPAAALYKLNSEVHLYVSNASLFFLYLYDCAHMQFFAFLLNAHLGLNLEIKCPLWPTFI